MPVKGYWLVPHKVYCQKIYGQLETHDLNTMRETMHEATTNGHTHWYNIVDILEMEKLSISFRETLHSMQNNRPSQNNPPIQQIVLLNNRAFRFMGEIFSKALSEQYSYFATRDEVINYLRQQVPELSAEIDDNSFQ